VKLKQELQPEGLKQVCTEGADYSTGAYGGITRQYPQDGSSMAPVGLAPWWTCNVLKINPRISEDGMTAKFIATVDKDGHATQIPQADVWAGGIPEVKLSRPENVYVLCAHYDESLEVVGVFDSKEQAERASTLYIWHLGRKDIQGPYYGMEIQTHRLQHFAGPPSDSDVLS
jgi:hypothetical protein